MLRIRIGFARPPLHLLVATVAVWSFCSLPIKAGSHEDDDARAVSAWLNAEACRSTVKEIIPPEYRRRYQKWKTEYLSTSAGRAQWEQYALSQSFNLTITVSKEKSHGALVSDFIWNEDGRLISATIMLGNKLDSGYPNPINYPITCSLSPDNIGPDVKGTILAAAKLSHEFGHLNQVMAMDGRLYQLQNRLMIEYNRLIGKVDFNTLDPQLLELVGEMGGTPVQIAQEREHWAEMGVIEYLQERLPQLTKRSRMPQPIQQAIDAYYSAYPGRSQN